jgi:hypothetical protein
MVDWGLAAPERDAFTTGESEQIFLRSATA